MSIVKNWFILGVATMFFYAACVLLLKKLTLHLPSSSILLYVFTVLALYYLMYNLVQNQLAKPDPSLIWLIMLTALMLFLGSFCEVEAIRHAPNAGYAAALKSGQILIVTIAAYFLFENQQISWQGILGSIFILLGVILLGWRASY